MGDNKELVKKEVAIPASVSALAILIFTLLSLNPSEDLSAYLEGTNCEGMAWIFENQTIKSAEDVQTILEKYNCLEEQNAQESVLTKYSVEGKEFVELKTNIKLNTLQNTQTKKSFFLENGTKIAERKVLNSIDATTNTILDCDILTCTWKIQFTPQINLRLRPSDLTGDFQHGSLKSVSEPYFLEEETYKVEIQGNPIYVQKKIKNENASCKNCSEYQTYDEIVGYEPSTTEIKTRIIKDYDISSLILEAGKTYIFYIDFHKNSPAERVDIYDTVLGVENKELAWWNSSWNNRIQINVTNTAGEKINATLNFTLNTSNFNYSHSYNGSDLRVLNSTEDGELDFWVNWSNNSNSILYVRIPTLANGSSYFYLYYGNANATNKKNETVLAHQYYRFAYAGLITSHMPRSDEYAWMNSSGGNVSPNIIFESVVDQYGAALYNGNTGCADAGEYMFAVGQYHGVYFTSKQAFNSFSAHSSFNGARGAAMNITFSDNNSTYYVAHQFNYTVTTCQTVTSSWFLGNLATPITPAPSVNIGNEEYPTTTSLTPAISLNSTAFCDNFGDGGTCDHGYSANWVQIATMEADENWWFASYPNVTNDTIHYKEGMQSLMGMGYNSDNLYIRRNLSTPMDLTSYENISIWSYATDWAKVRTDSNILIFLDSRCLDAHRFGISPPTLGLPTTGSGWAYGTAPRTSFSITGSPSWADIMYAQVSVRSTPSNYLNLSFDNLRAVGANGQFYDAANNRTNIITNCNFTNQTMVMSEIQNTTDGKAYIIAQPNGGALLPITGKNFTATTKWMLNTTFGSWGVGFIIWAKNTTSNDTSFCTTNLIGLDAGNALTAGVEPSYGYITEVNGNQAWGLALNATNFTTAGVPFNLTKNQWFYTKVVANYPSVQVYVSNDSATWYLTASGTTTNANITGDQIFLGIKWCHRCVIDNILIQPHMPNATNTTDNNGIFTRGQALEASALVEGSGEVVGDWYQDGTLNKTAPRAVAYYPFDAPLSNATYTPDLSIAGGNDANVSGATWQSNGIKGGAYSFDGTTSGNVFINISNTSALNPIGTGSQISFGAWLKPQLGGGFTGRRFWIGRSGGGTTGGYWGEITESGLPLCDFQTVMANGTIRRIDLTTTPAVTNGVWLHQFCSFNGTDAKIYINGVLSNTYVLASPENLSAYSETTVIGNLRASLPAYTFNGSIDEVYIYNQSLTADEISQLYRKGMIGSELNALGLTYSTGAVWYANFSSYQVFNITQNVSVSNVGLVNISLSDGITAIRFLPYHGLQTNVSPVNQTQNIGLFNISNLRSDTTYNYSLYLNATRTGILVFCAPYVNQTNSIVLNTSSQRILTLTPENNSYIWCWANYSNPSGLTWTPRFRFEADPA